MKQTTVYTFFQWENQFAKCERLVIFLAVIHLVDKQESTKGFGKVRRRLNLQHCKLVFETFCFTDFRNSMVLFALA